MKGGLTVSSAIVTMVTSMMGTGINYMPCAFKFIGYVLGVSFILLIGALTFFSLYAVSIAASKSSDPNPSYSSLSIPISKMFKIIVDVSIFSSCFGANISFYRYLGKLILKMFPMIVTYIGNEEMSRKIVVSILAIPFFFLAAQKNLSNLKITSYITVISVTYLAILMVTYCTFIGGSCATEAIKPFESRISDGVPFFILAMACQANMVKVYTELEHKSTQNIIKVSLGAALFGTLIYGLVGMCGYVVFGHSIDTTIIDSLIDSKSSINVYLMEKTFDKYAISSRAACIGAMLVLFGGFPVQLNPIAGILVSYFIRDKADEGGLRPKVTLVLMSILLGLALVEDINIDTLLKLVSSTAVNLSSFLYPSIYYIYYSRKRDAMNILSLLVGIMSIVAMFYMTYNILSG